MDGIRVHDVASMYAGPVVVTFLADLGAVEPPGGDALRHFAFGGVSHLRRTTEHESAGPQVGEHTEEILSGELGLSEATLADLRANVVT